METVWNDITEGDCNRCIGISVRGYFEIVTPKIIEDRATVYFTGMYEDKTITLDFYGLGLNERKIDNIYPHPSGEYFALVCGRDALFYNLEGDILGLVDGSLFPEYVEEKESDEEVDSDEEDEINLDNLYFNHSLFICYLEDGFLVGTTILWSIYYEDFCPVGIIKHSKADLVPSLFEKLHDLYKNLPILAEGMAETERFLTSAIEIGAVGKISILTALKNLVTCEGEYTFYSDYVWDVKGKRYISVKKGDQNVDPPVELQELFDQYTQLFEKHCEIGAVVSDYIHTVRTQKYNLLYSPSNQGCLVANHLTIQNRATGALSHIELPRVIQYIHENRVVVSGDKIAILSFQNHIGLRIERNFRVLTC